MKHLVCIILFLGLTSCMIDGSSDSDGTSSDPTISPTVIASSCYSPGVGTRATDYFKFDDPIIGKQADGATAVWSTTQYLTPTIDHNVLDHFTTDGLLKFRVVAKPSPGKIDGLCQFEAGGPGAEYTKLRAKVRIRAYSNTSDNYTFTTPDLPVGTCTDPIVIPTSSIPVNSFSPYEPFIVEIIDVHSDLHCIWSGGTYGCPMARHAMPDCFEFDIQMVTSSTKDFY